MVSTSDVRALGYTSRAIQRQVDAGDWVRLRRGHYTTRGRWAAADDVQRHLLVARAVARPLVGKVALTGTTGALALGLDTWRPPLRTVHVARLDGRGSSLEYGVSHHERPAVDGGYVRVDDDFLITPPTWTLASAMTQQSLEGAVSVADSAARRGLVSTAELDELAERWRHRPWSRRLRLATRLSDGRADNAGESACRIIIFWRCGIPRPVLQFEVIGPDGQIAYTDFAWPELGVVGEFDGRRKYERDARPGEDPGEVVWREKRREDWIVETGLLMRRAVIADLFNPRPAADRFRRAIDRRRAG